jgi:predicted nucleotidyltransferase
MKVSGIIAEYNPFHNGHAYQLEKAKKETGADYLIIAMSGDFLQRGVPAMLDKYERTKMALLSGADLVLELPVQSASASAEYFASAGISLLAETGVVSTVCYGCEDEKKELVQALCGVLSAESEVFSDTVKKLLKKGLSYPEARSEAVCLVLSSDNNFDEKEVRDFLNSPNNILALEYEKAISQLNRSGSGNRLAGHAILRKGEGYHSTRTENGFASATAIRALLTGKSCCDYGIAGQAVSTPDMIRSHVPSKVCDILCEAAGNNRLITPDDFSEVLFSRLWALRETGYEKFADCGTDLSFRIVKNLDKFLSFSQFAELVKSRNLTYTRVCRALLHIMLGIKRSGCEVPYLRVLGFKKGSEALLSAIKKEASAPLITKAADASGILSDEALKLLNLDMRCADLYRTVVQMRSGIILPNEYTQGLVIL